VRTAIVSGILFLSGCKRADFRDPLAAFERPGFGNSVWSACPDPVQLYGWLGTRQRDFRLYQDAETDEPDSVFTLCLSSRSRCWGCTMVFGIPVLGEWMRPAFQALWGARYGPQWYCYYSCRF